MLDNTLRLRMIYSRLINRFFDKTCMFIIHIRCFNKRKQVLSPNRVALELYFFIFFMKAIVTKESFNVMTKRWQKHLPSWSIWFAIYDSDDCFYFPIQQIKWVPLEPCHYFRVHSSSILKLKSRKLKTKEKRLLKFLTCHLVDEKIEKNYETLKRFTNISDEYTRYILAKRSIRSSDFLVTGY